MGSDCISSCTLHLMSLFTLNIFTRFSIIATGSVTNISKKKKKLIYKFMGWCWDHPGLNFSSNVRK